MTTWTAHCWKSPTIGIVQQEMDIFLHISNQIIIRKELLILQIEVKANFTWWLTSSKLKKMRNLSKPFSIFLCANHLNSQNPGRGLPPKKSHISLFWIARRISGLCGSWREPLKERDESISHVIWGCVGFFETCQTRGYVTFEESIFKGNCKGPQ